MAQVDASIPLSANPAATAGPDLGKMLSLAEMAQDIQVKRAGLAKQNALATLMGNPTSYAPDGSFTPQAVQAISAVDPNTGMKVREQTLEEKVQKAQAAHYETEAGKAKWNYLSNAAGIATDAYNDAKKAGRSEADARAAAMQARNEALKNNGGALSDSDVSSATATPFDPLQAKTFAMSNTDYSKRQNDTRKEDNAEKKETELERHNRETEERMGKALTAKAETAEAKPGQQETIKVKDAAGNVNEVQAFVKGPGQVVDIAGNPIDPASIVGASKIGSGGQPRSGSALAVTKFMQENPSANSADIQKFLAKGAGQSAAVRSLMGGADGKQLTALGVATDHLTTLRDLNEAFKGGDQKTIAAAKARWETEFGNPAPSNMEVAAQFVAPELIKAIEGSPGGVAERDELAAKFKGARGQANVDGAIDTAFALMGGQLNGMRNKLVKTEKIISNDEFDDIVPSVARDAMAKHQTGGSKGGLSFDNEDAAHKAAEEGKIKPGDIITIGGKKMTVQQ